jgi:hypothetical protein
VLANFPTGFQVQMDEAHERTDIILNRPPFNIVSMPQRDQLRLTTALIEPNFASLFHRTVNAVTERHVEYDTSRFTAR